jgi:hypothetical protein
MKTKEELLAVSDCDIVSVFVPEWDTDVYIRKLNGAEVTKLRKMNEQKKEATYVMAMTCVIAVCDESGLPVFTASDAPTLEQKSFAAVDFLSTEILIHSKCMKRKEGEEGTEKN